MNLELVIFDCDGVLVDSEPIANRVFTAAVQRLGFDWSYDEVCRRFIGRSMKHCMEEIERDLGRPLPERFLDDLQRDTYDAFREEGLQAVRGVEDAIDRLEQPFCVASSGSFEKMRTTLGITGLLPRFADRMFSAQQVERGKPAPDLFLHVAATLDLKPGQCVVIEDSVPGVQAAVEAGMRALGYAERSNRDALAAAGAFVFDTMEDLPGLIGERTSTGTLSTTRDRSR